MRGKISNIFVMKLRNNSFLFMYILFIYFQIHFSDDMWEKPRSDGKQKLKQNAVPTIFNNILTCDVS